MDERDVDEAEPDGESFGVEAPELAAVEKVESVVVVRLNAARCGRAVVLILTGVL